MSNAKELVVFVEEKSAQTLLEFGILPRIIPEDIKFRCIPFEGKQDLEKNVGRKLIGWGNASANFVILRDKDSGDCIKIKEGLRQICVSAQKPNTLIRIACCELESWYLGDLKAVEIGLGLKGLSKKQNISKFRDPDGLNNAKQELRRITNNQYQPIIGSQLIGPAMNLKENTSKSFNTFVTGISKMLAR